MIFRANHSQRQHWVMSFTFPIVAPAANKTRFLNLAIATPLSTRTQSLSPIYVESVRLPANVL